MSNIFLQYFIYFSEIILDGIITNLSFKIDYKHIYFNMLLYNACIVSCNSESETFYGDQSVDTMTQTSPISE